MLPPEMMNDYDFHLENDIRNLRKLRSQTDYIIILFSSKDLQSTQFAYTLKTISTEIKSAKISM